MPLKISFEVAAAVQAFHFFTLRAKIKNSETTLSSRSCLRWRWSLADLRGTRSGLEKSSSSWTFSNQLDNKKWKHTKRENDTKYLFANFYESIKIFFLFFTSGQKMTNVFLWRKKKRKRAAAVHFKFGKKRRNIFAFWNWGQTNWVVGCISCSSQISLAGVGGCDGWGCGDLSKSTLLLHSKNSATRVVLRRRKITRLTQVKEGPCFKSERWFASENVFFFKLSTPTRNGNPETKVLFYRRKKISTEKVGWARIEKKMVDRDLPTIFFFWSRNEEEKKKLAETENWETL